MKKRLLTLALALALLAGLAAPAGAYYRTSGGSFNHNQETADFWAQHPYSEDALYAGVGAAEFGDGLLLVHNLRHGDNDCLYDYVDKNGNLMNLNRGRFNGMFGFHSGYAAVTRDLGYDYDEKRPLNNCVGYIDTKGSEVIPANKDWLAYNPGGVFFAGRFENGKAVVIKNDPRAYAYAYIDTKGKYLTNWTYVDSPEAFYKLPLYSTEGIWIGHYMHPETAPTSDTAAGSSPSETGSQTPAETFTPQWHAPGLPGYNTNAPSQFASTAKVTGFYLGDMDMGTTYVTVTNPTDQVDAGVVAVAFVNVDGSDGAGVCGDGVFFISYEVAPGQSEVYDFNSIGIINESMFRKGAPYAQQLASHVEATVFTFEDQADLENFYQTIPYEQYWYPQGLSNEFQPICDGAPGDQWLAQIAGIHRQGRLLSMFDYELPNGQSINAEKAQHSQYCNH